MFESVGRTVILLGGAAGLTFCLAGGVAVGVVPQAGSTTASSLHTEAVAPQDPATTMPPDTAAPAVAAPDAPAPVATTTVTAPRAASRSEAATSAPDQGASVAADSPAAAGPGPAGPATAPRLTPTSAQVQAAIAQIGAGLPVTEAQARDFGNQVCSALDQGQSGTQVKAAALQAAKKVPFVVVSAAQVDSAVRAAVQLFCPGYASRV